MRTIALAFLCSGTIVFMTGCAPTRLTDVERNANQGLLSKAFADQPSQMHVVSAGDQLRLRVSFSESQVCEGEFRLTRESKGFTLLVYTQYAQLVYDGKWNAPESAPCKMLLGELPYKDNRVLVSDGIHRWVTVCVGHWATSPFDCKMGRQYYFDEK